jgi:hypothetical protein
MQGLQIIPQIQLYKLIFLLSSLYVHAALNTNVLGRPSTSDDRSQLLPFLVTELDHHVGPCQGILGVVAAGIQRAFTWAPF